ncbi:MAG: hypothetical protein GXO75_15985 [Calditrichaeota bacterium]|nr:hypothetical protein [Calditrichota bacterium]
MKSLWGKIPEQIPRLSVLLVILVVLFIVVRSRLVPPDFGKYGHYRASAVDEIISQEIRYAGHEVCAECHDDVVGAKKAGYHKNVACEVCHGPAVAHTEDPGSVELRAPRARRYCPLCHEYRPSRPTGFPQIVSNSHNPMKPCITCHDPHDPKPPVTPKECHACHGAIARTKSLSHHVYVPCTRCHETPDEHKVRPRIVVASKPKTREFCGECHAKDAPSEKSIPRVDLATHGERYVCWQCHYPHLPEAR